MSARSCGASCAEGRQPRSRAHRIAPTGRKTLKAGHAGCAANVPPGLAPGVIADLRSSAVGYFSSSKALDVRQSLAQIGVSGIGPHEAAFVAGRIARADHPEAAAKGGGQAAVDSHLGAIAAGTVEAASGYGTDEARGTVVAAAVDTGKAGVRGVVATTGNRAGRGPGTVFCSPPPMVALVAMASFSMPPPHRGQTGRRSRCRCCCLQSWRSHHRLNRRRRSRRWGHPGQRSGR
jgi:hypothetical protein